MVFEVGEGQFNHALYATLDLDPEAYANEEFADVFKSIGADLIECHSLVANGISYRFVELEFYLNVKHHMDEFTHSTPQQKETAAWYFHRFGNGTYKSGTFKGLDITFARKGFHGGILVRGLKNLDPSSGGSVIDGPSTVVEHLLRVCGVNSIGELVGKLENLQVCDTSNILHIAPCRRREVIPLYTSARVGLTLNKKRGNIHNLLGYICRPYRFYTHPRETKKGRVQMILGLLRQGRSEEEVHAITGSPRASIATYLRYYKEGVRLKSFEWEELDTYRFCLLHGYLDSRESVNLI